jgi:hypothetical protein
MTSAVSEGDFNEFLHTICVCSVCHVINRTRVLLFTTVAGLSQNIGQSETAKSQCRMFSTDASVSTAWAVVARHGGRQSRGEFCQTFVCCHFIIYELDH